MKHRLQWFGLLFAVTTGANASPPVRVSLRSSWSAPSTLIEVLETVSLENPDAFFPLVDRLTDPEVLQNLGSLTPEAVHQAALQVASSNGILADTASLAAVEMNLALHAATPKIEAFYNYYEDHHIGRAGTECGSWVDWYGQVVCDVETLAQLAGVETIDAANKDAKAAFPRPRLLTFDHVQPSPARLLQPPPRTAIFYASPSSSNFRELHTYLYSLTDKANPHVEYVFRHVPPKARSSEQKNNLSGYGVALNLKKMDYLALDDRNTHANDAKKGSSLTEEAKQVDMDLILDLIHNFPENATAPDPKTPLSEEEVQDIGFKATQLVANSSEPLIALTRLSQNFPKYATALSRRVVVNESLAAEIHANNLKAQGGAHVMWLNGITVNDKDVNPLGLLRLLKKERATVSSLTNLGLSRLQAFELLTHASVVQSQKAADVLGGMFDASDRPEGGDLIVYWNDMEKDSRYARWSPSLFNVSIYPLLMVIMLISGFVAPSHVLHGFPTVKLNLFNVVLVLDLSQTTSIQFLAGPMANIIERTFPLRFGIVPVVETVESKKMARLFFHLIKNYGRKKTLAFISNLADQHGPDVTTVQWKVIQDLYEDLTADEDAAPALSDIIVGKEADNTPLDSAAAYAQRLGANLATSPHGHAFLNGKHFKFDDMFLRSMQQEVGQQMQFLQEKVYEGKITDEHNETISTYFYDQPSTSAKRNRYIHLGGAGSNLQLFNLPELFAKTRFQAKASSFLYPQETGKIPLTTYVVADLDSEAGEHLVKEALASVVPGTQTRISFIHNPEIDPSELTTRPVRSGLLAHLISTNTLPKTSPSLLARALGADALPTDDETQAVLSRDDALLKVTGNVKVNDFDPAQYTKWVTASRLLVRDLQLKPGQSALVANGRLVGPIEAKDFSATDFATLESYELKKRTEPVIQALEEIDDTLNDKDRASYAQTVSFSSSIISAIQQPDPSESGLFNQDPRPRSKSYQFLDSEYTAFYAGDNSTALYRITVVIDPLSETTQKWSSLLQWLSNIPDTFIEVHLNPARHREIPLKSFYRYNLLPSLSFDNDGQEIPARVTFEDLPTEPIYTLAMDVPPSWLVRPREAAYDLDNLQLGHLLPGDRSVDAIFDLDYLVVEGHARELFTNSAPRGVQLELVGGDSVPIDDTLVVANLGYLQFKAKPGVFTLQIRQGRGRDIFKMSSVGNDGWDSPTVDEVGSDITLTSFEGLTLYPKLARLPGKERADVLADSADDGELHGLFGDIASRVTSLFKTKEQAPAKVEEQAEINIFTVASGLLYERFASIMILSVLRNTNSTVKFWFIENFLSPSFLEFIPHMAEKYNFKYELVTYKWPTWLREQKEKQRIIWAYKILFLDVLFPMDLKKVIFVDADQIVRADLKELVDLDLHGAPYGYTPMGDDNTDMEGFRFWKTGYWKEFLQGRPYHISALYVVDLVRFRQMAAGDILRGQYQQLSADPNSLANLDQDLPNNLQREVPIFSLGEDWLWCETWCSKDRLDRAKTIDLCQNPLTKEPKLSRARQIPEWEEYDSEIAKFTRKLAEDGLIHSGMAAADVNALANAGSVPAAAGSSEGDSEPPTQGTDATKEEHPRDEL